MDMKLFEYDDAFGTVLGMDKKERLLARDSSMTQFVLFLPTFRLPPLPADLLP
jgi:aminopeptidase C